MKRALLVMTASLLSIAASSPALASEEIVGSYRVECTTSYPKTGAGIQAMTIGLIKNQLKAGYSQIISTTATKVGWADVSSDHGEVAVCVTARKSANK